jgi:hypothetical protein
MFKKIRRDPMFSQATAKGFFSYIGGRETYHKGYVQVELQIILAGTLIGKECEL